MMTIDDKIKADVVVKEMVPAWVLTFPICGAIGFAVAKLFSVIF